MDDGRGATVAIAIVGADVFFLLRWMKDVGEKEV